MGNKNDSLGDRMKRYENVPKVSLVRRMPVIIRLDGKAFHTFTRGFDKPFDPVLMQTMNDTMTYLCENIQGCVLGYTQSDEITLVLVDYQTLTSDAWFDNNVEKMCSISASMATLAFNKAWRKNVDAWAASRIAEWYDGGTNDPDGVDQVALKQAELYVSRFDKALFDSRVFNIPKEEVMNCLVWRQQDATRNSIQSAGQANFSHKQLMGKSCDQIQDMLFNEKGINWNDYPTSCKRGTCCVKRMVRIIPEVMNRPGAKIVERKKWVIDYDIPIFNRQPDYINSLVFLE